MIEKTTIVTNETGIHARPAALLVNYVKNFPGEIMIKYGEKTGNLKSILNVMALGIKKGSEVTIQVTGENEEEFANEVIGFIGNLRG